MGCRIAIQSFVDFNYLSVISFHFELLTHDIPMV